MKTYRTMIIILLVKLKTKSWKLNSRKLWKHKFSFFFITYFQKPKYLSHAVSLLVYLAKAAYGGVIEPVLNSGLASQPC